MREAAARLRWGFATAPGDSAMAVSDAWAALADVLDVVAASESASALGSAAARWHARRSSARSAALRMLGADLRTLATLDSLEKENAMPKAMLDQVRAALKGPDGIMGFATQMMGAFAGGGAGGRAGGQRTRFDLDPGWAGILVRTLAAFAG